LASSIAVSVILHLAFLSASTVWWIPGAQALMNETRKMFDIQTVAIRPLPFSQVQLIRAYVRKLKFQKPGEEARKVAGLSPDLKREIEQLKKEGWEEPKKELVVAKQELASDASQDFMKDEIAANQLKTAFNGFVNIPGHLLALQAAGAILSGPSVCQERCFSCARA